MGTWKSRGLRGSTLEELINFTNDKYKEQGIGLIQKIPTPIKPINIDKSKGHITLAYFEQKSTVDYIGVVQGIPICFDAKECNTDTIPMHNIHKHKIEFMQDFEKQKGVAFILLSLTAKNEMYFIPFRHIKIFYDRMEAGGRKSFKYDEIDKSYLITQKPGVPVHYLPCLQRYLDEIDY